MLSLRLIVGMNDPCAPGCLPSGGFTLMYQWNPHSHQWANISWGQVDSDDMVKWRYVKDEVGRRAR
jgi:sucrose-6-phosphate hydrolase SacC (GH32 family)